MCFRPAAIKKGNKCTKCQTINPDGVETCSNCGEALPKLAAPPGVKAPGAPGMSAPGAVPPPGTPKAPPSGPKMPPAPPQA